VFRWKYEGVGGESEYSSHPIDPKLPADLQHPLARHAHMSTVVKKAAWDFFPKSEIVLLLLIC